jgi:protein-tyrosine-phosphatase
MKFEAEKISPEKAIEILKKDGLEVTLEQAKIILEFLYQMSEIVIEQYLEKAN